MSALNVHSHNLRGSLKYSSEIFAKTLKDPKCECTALLLQDVGATDHNGPALLKQCLGEDSKHSMFANSSKCNKSRTVAIVVHKNCYRDPTGSLIGVVASSQGMEILFISA